MIIKSNIRDYSVTIEKNFNFISGLLKSENAFFVVDKIVFEIYKEKLFQSVPAENIFLIEALETNKTIETALEICEVMTSIPAKRNARLISFGGGIIQDITGFAANILYRGIHWTFVPTTLLAGCDSCIGGKTSLNYKKYKNLLGTFYPPDAIFICSEFFNTLSERDFKSGLGEVVKFNIMTGNQGLINIENNIDALLERDKEKLDEFVNQSILFKKDYIEKDEFDKGVRIHLNFAHTFAHAFETVSNYYIPHGTAVAMGMLVANRISLGRGLLEESIVIRIESVMKKIIDSDLLQAKLPIDNMIDAIRKDKKQTDSNLKCVLLSANMELNVYNDLRKEEAEQAITYVLQVLSK